MNLAAFVVSGVWTGLFAAAVAVVFSAPYSGLLPSFCGGFVARFARDALVAAGMNANLATAIAAALVIFAAAALIRRPGVSPVVMVSALLPLGAALAFFRAIIDFLRIWSLPDDKLAAVPHALLLNLSKVFTTTVAIGIGMLVAVYIVRFLLHEPVE